MYKFFFLFLSYIFFFFGFRSASFSALASLLIFIRSGIFPFACPFFYHHHRRHSMYLICIQFRLCILHRVVFFTGVSFLCILSSQLQFLFSFFVLYSNFSQYFLECSCLLLKMNKEKIETLSLFSSATVLVDVHSNHSPE